MLERHELAGGGYVAFDPNFLEPAEADRCFSELRQGIAWEQGYITLFGRRIAEPRLTAWFGEEYTYSGRTLKKVAFPELLLELKQRVELAVGQSFNSVLANLYRGGRDSMGLHADDEPELGTNPLIASVSLGATRRFVLRPKKQVKQEAGAEYDLTHGSLLVMGGTCQHLFRHGVPKQPTISGERINLTFRNLR